MSQNPRFVVQCDDEKLSDNLGCTSSVSGIPVNPFLQRLVNLRLRSSLSLPRRSALPRTPQGEPIYGLDQFIALRRVHQMNKRTRGELEFFLGRYFSNDDVIAYG
jgi:hypothetical protein